MKIGLFYRLFFVFSLWSAIAGAFDSPQFIQWLKAYTTETSPVIGQQVLTKARRFHYVFVKGFLNENTLNGYFEDNISELKALGVLDSDITVVAPSSVNTFAENHEILQQGLMNVKIRKDQKIVIIGHSRGAVDALAFAIKHPDFAREKIEALFLIQGAFGGSAVADYIQGEGRPISSKVPSTYREQFDLIATTAGFLSNALELDAGLKELTHRRASLFWSEILAKNAATVAEVSKKTFYILGHKMPARMSTFLRASGFYIHFSYPCEDDGKGEKICPNDGMMARMEQFLPKVGTILVDILADHADLTNSMHSSSDITPRRLALTRAIFTAVGQ